jgi:hypothetical protein
MELNLTSYFMQRIVPLIMKEVGPQVSKIVGPIVAEKVGIPLAKKVGLPIAKKIGMPIARKAGTILLNKVGYPMVSKMLFNQASSGSNAAPVQESNSVSAQEIKPKKNKRLVGLLQAKKRNGKLKKNKAVIPASPLPPAPIQPQGLPVQPVPAPGSAAPPVPQNIQGISSDDPQNPYPNFSGYNSLFAEDASIGTKRLHRIAKKRKFQTKGFRL